MVDRGAAAQAEWQKSFDAWAAANPERKALFDRLIGRELPDGWTDALPTLRADPKGVATRAASGEVLTALGRGAARAVGRLGRPGRDQQHHDEGRRSFVPAGARHQDVAGATRTAARCTSASASTRWARS